MSSVAWQPPCELLATLVREFPLHSTQWGFVRRLQVHARPHPKSASVRALRRDDRGKLLDRMRKIKLNAHLDGQIAIPSAGCSRPPTRSRSSSSHWRARSPSSCRLVPSARNCNEQTDPVHTEIRWSLRANSVQVTNSGALSSTQCGASLLAVDTLKANELSGAAQVSQ